MSIYYTQDWLDKVKEQIEEVVKTYSDQEVKIPLGEVEDIKLFLVNEDYINKHLEIDYVCAGNGQRYDFIPKDEIWLSIQNLFAAKYDFFHEFLEQYLMKKYGLEYDEAHKICLEEEKKYRDE
jgi:hypothetical protein